MRKKIAPARTPQPEDFFAAEIRRLKRTAPTAFHKWIPYLMRAAAWHHAPHYMPQIGQAFHEHPDWTVESLKSFRARMVRNPASFLVHCRGARPADEKDEAAIAEFRGVSADAFKKARQRAAKGL